MYVRTIIIGIVALFTSLVCFASLEDPVDYDPHLRLRGWHLIPSDFGQEASGNSTFVPESPSIEADLHQAVASGILSRVQALVQNGYSVNLRNAGGHTPLHIAALNGYWQLIRYLAGQGADLNAQDNNGNTSLHLAILFAKPDVVEELIALGARVTLANDEGDTVLTLASDILTTTLVAPEA